MLFTRGRDISSHVYSEQIFYAKTGHAGKFNLAKTVFSLEKVEMFV